MPLLSVHSELAGKVVAIAARAGQALTAGQELLTLEAMKMEIPVDAPGAGRLLEICIAEGDMVSEGQLLARLEV